MTRDGTFVIRNGEIAHPIKSLRFTQSYVEGLKYTEAIGETTRLLRSGFGGAVSVPAVKLAKFRFTSSTRLKWTQKGTKTQEIEMTLEKFVSLFGSFEW